MHWRVHRRSDHERRKNEKRGDVRREETRKLLLFDERGRNEDRRAGDGQPHEVHQPQLPTQRVDVRCDRGRRAKGIADDRQKSSQGRAAFFQLRPSLL